MGVLQNLNYLAADPRGPLGWITAWIMPSLSDAYCGSMAQLLRITPEDDVLDVACGAGAFLQKHASQARYVAGIDQSEIQIRMARKRLRDRIASGTAEFVLGDATRLPWGDGTFSVVTCNCLNCFVDPVPAVREMYRVLRPGGQAAFGLESCPDEDTARREEQRWGLPYWTEAGFTKMLTDAGFSAVSVSREKKLVFVKATRVGKNPLSPD